MDLEKLWTDKLEGRAWQVKEEFLSLLSYMQDHKVKNVLEIGTYKGGSALGFLEIGCAVDSIDIIKQPEIEDIEKNYDKFKFFFRSAPSLLINPPYDMLYIDAEHSYVECKRDYEEFSPWVKPKGLFVFHDVVKSKLHEEQDCEVWKVLQEFEPTIPPITIVTDGKWGGIFIMEKQ